MKNLLLLTLVVSVSACTVISKLSKQNIKFNEGDDLIYEINTKDEDDDKIKYEIELNINGVADEYVSFDWDIFAERSGVIAMDENAINTAKTISFFEESGYQAYDDKTAIWVSRTIFKNLKFDNKVEIGLDERKEIFQKTGTETYSFGNKDNGIPYSIPVITVSNTDNSVEMWIADDLQNPIIVRLTMKDFRMDLTDYKLFR